jgi:ArsR family transcriptional regulator, arsenate/arsenite/antimonite-responsive transcriptional repressor
MKSITVSEKARSEARARILKALAHPTRIFIVEKLQSRPYCVCDLTEMVGADTSTVSKHLSLLKAAGIVEDRKEGTTVYYSLACECISHFMDGLESIMRKNLSRQRAALARFTV